MINRIAILGVGLIGGSLGKIWKERRPEIFITGFDYPDVLNRALELGAIDAAASTIVEAVRSADVIVLAAPLQTNSELMKQLAPILNFDTIVLDTGSVKRLIEITANDCLPYSALFIGGHPMAGSEHSGIEQINSYLFENATFVLCPSARVLPMMDSARIKVFLELLSVLGSRILIVDAEVHDRIAATVSHLPQILAVLLTNLVQNRMSEKEPFLDLAAGGFRDMTRIASSSFHLWEGILTENKQPIVEVLDRFSNMLRTIRSWIVKDDFASVGESFSQAHALRVQIPSDSKGFLNPLFEILVGVADRPGALALITSALSENGLNIKDIELLKIRIGTGGTFRLGFDQKNAAKRAIIILKQLGIEARFR